MSIESAKAFLERMKTDEDFRKEVGEKSSPEDRAKLVKDNGFDFTKEAIYADLVKIASAVGLVRRNYSY